MIYVIGDSFANPGYGATGGHGFVPTLLHLLGDPACTNYGISGGQTADQTTHLCSINVLPGDVGIVEMGTNDHWVYGNDATKRGYFKSGLMAVVAWLATPEKTLGRNVPVSDISGPWVNTPSFGIGRKTTAPGSTIKFKVSGDAVYLGTIQFDGIDGSFSVSIDGIDKGIFQTNAPGMTTRAGMPCGQRLFRFSGLGCGDHNVIVRSIRSNVFAEWCAGSDQPSKPKVFVGSLTRQTSAGYASSGKALSDSTIAIYNGDISSMVTMFRSDWLDVRMVDNTSNFFPYSDTFSDGVHPNDTGHCKIAMNFHKAMA